QLGIVAQQAQHARADGAQPGDADRQRPGHPVTSSGSAALLSACKKPRIFRTACRSRCVFSTSAIRTWLSPYSPKPIPGATATLARESKSLLNPTDPSEA